MTEQLWFTNTNSLLRGLLTASHKPYKKVTFCFSEDINLDFERFDKRSIYITLHGSIFLEVVFGDRFFYVKKDNVPLLKGSAQDLFTFFNMRFHQLHCEYRYTTHPTLDVLPF